MGSSVPSRSCPRRTREELGWLRGAADDEAWAIRLDTKGAIFVGGKTRSKTDDQTRRAWALKFDRDGFLVWERSLDDGRVNSLLHAGSGMYTLLDNGAVYLVETEQGEQAPLNWNGKQFYPLA
jgi:hypothetical protein